MKSNCVSERRQPVLTACAVGGNVYHFSNRSSSYLILRELPSPIDSVTADVPALLSFDSEYAQIT